MNFVSLQFLLFAILTLFVYWNLNDKFRPTVLLIASYIFYCFWDWRFASILIFVTLSNFFLTKLMYDATSNRIKKRLLAICLTQNLTILFIFKYFNFFTDSAQRVFDFIGLSLDFPTINVLLPLGLSFLVFQTSSYIVDVYRGTIGLEKSFINFATFVVYFPHMAAGPIMPSKVLLPQISMKKVTPDFDGIQSALFLIVIGLFKKIVIADTLAPFVNRVYGGPTLFDWKSLTLAAIAFGLQIYGDFAGYSSIARGVSRLFGIEMMLNFRQPYLSTSITDFWRRWHISLSTWFRDYLYIPLGGNRGKSLKTSLNLMFVMVVAGLWHGAALGFIFWGFLHGLFLVVDKHFKRDQNLGKSKIFVVSFFGWLATQISVFFAWIFFRNPDFGDAAYVIKSIIQRTEGTFEISDALLVMTALVVTFLLDLFEVYLIPKHRRINPFAKGLLLGVLLVVVFTLKSSSIIPFIYFEF